MLLLLALQSYCFGSAKLLLLAHKVATFGVAKVRIISHIAKYLPQNSIPLASASRPQLLPPTPNCFCPPNCFFPKIAFSHPPTTINPSSTYPPTPLKPCFEFPPPPRPCFEFPHPSIPHPPLPHSTSSPLHLKSPTSPGPCNASEALPNPCRSLAETLPKPRLLVGTPSLLVWYFFAATTDKYRRSTGDIPKTRRGFDEASTRFRRGFGKDT